MRRFIVVRYVRKAPKPTLKERAKKLWLWLRKTVLNLDMLPSFIIAEAIFWLPLWVPALLSVLGIVDLWYVVGAVLIFWGGPFTPAVPLQIGLALFIKKMFTSIKRRIKNGRKRN